MRDWFRKRHDMKITLGFILILSFSDMSLGADFTGTWKVNIEKSHPRNALAGATLKIEEIGPNTYRPTHQCCAQSGEKTHQEIKRIYDGKEHGMDAVPGGSEISEKLDAYTRKIIRKIDRKVAFQLTSTVSLDGKVMTNLIKGGWDETLVFERQ
jgi:hypothetical protein